MQVIVLADDSSWEEFQRVLTKEEIQVTRVETREALASFPDADAWFDLSFDDEENPTGHAEMESGPVLYLHAVCTSSPLPSRAIRLNAWPGFLEAGTWEVACSDPVAKEKATAVAAGLGKQLSWVPNQAGMVTPRILSMIINEAYLALEEGVSTREQIDKAMKLGTNYPWGPFEWAEKIGPRRIASLLLTMAARDKKYQPANTLVKEARI